jgi:hypothetical protein
MTSETFLPALHPVGNGDGVASKPNRPVFAMVSAMMSDHPDSTKDGDFL